MLSINWLILSVLMRVHRRSLLPCQGKWRGVPCMEYHVPNIKSLLDVSNIQTPVVFDRLCLVTFHHIIELFVAANFKRGSTYPWVKWVRTDEISERSRKLAAFSWNSVSYRYSIINPQNVSFSKTTRPSLSNVNQADGTDGKKDTSRFTMPVRAPIIFFSNGAHRHRQKKHATDHPCLHTDKVRVNQSRHANDSSSRSRQESWSSYRYFGAWSVPLQPHRNKNIDGDSSIVVVALLWLWW